MALISDNFEARAADVDERVDPVIRKERVAEALAIRKAKAAASDALVVGCDTVVLCDMKLFGKPKNRVDAYHMLKSLSGKTHIVQTGVCLKKGGRIKSFTESTEVTFCHLSERDIEWYLDTGEPFDKAGAYGIQGAGAVLISGINGDFYNVVGLPVARLKREIAEFLGAE